MRISDWFTPRRAIRRYRRQLSVWFVVGLLLVAVCLRLTSETTSPRVSVFDSREPVLVKRVVDGDTLLLADGTRVRLIGVNTPETKHPNRPVEPLGVEAAEFVKRHVEGRKVTLRFDRERRDRYRRILAYVYLDGWFLNEELILAGYSRAETRFPYSTRMKKRFRAAEASARAARRGLWAGVP